MGEEGQKTLELDREGIGIEFEVTAADGSGSGGAEKGAVRA